MNVKYLLVVLYTLLISISQVAVLSALSYNINSISVDHNIEYNTGSIVVVNNTLTLFECNLSRMKMQMHYSKLEQIYTYNSSVSFREGTDLSTLFNSTVAKNEIVVINKVSANIYRLKYRLWYRQRSGFETNTSVITTIVIAETKNIVLNTTMEILSNNTYDLFMYNMTLLLFKALSKGNIAYLEYKPIQQGNITVYFGKSVINNAVFSGEELRDKVIKRYLGRYIPTLNINNITLFFTSINKLAISSRFIDQAYLYSEKVEGPLAVLLVKYTPLVVLPPTYFDNPVLIDKLVEGSISITSEALVVNANRSTSRGYVYTEYIYGFNVEDINSKIKNIISYLIDTSSIKNIEVTYSIKADKGFLKLNERTYEEILFTPTNITEAQNLVYIPPGEIRASTIRNPVGKSTIYHIAGLLIVVIVLLLVLFFKLGRKLQK